MPFELSITVKNEEKRTTKKHHLYDECQVSIEDPIIKAHIDAAVREFGEAMEDLDIRVKIALEVQ